MRSPVPQLDLPAGVLLRLAMDDGAWAEGLPPVPAGFDVTVSFVDEDAADVHGTALGLLGFRSVGVTGVGSGVDVLVPRALVEGHPAWWRAVLAKSERAFSLAHGPVLALLGPVLQRHQR